MLYEVITGPQPVIEGTPAEVSMDEETPVQAPTGEQPRQRRPRRQPRRSQKAEDGSASEGDAAPPALAEAGE